MGERRRAGDTPDNCDCCGHDAEDCGMDEQGWITRDATSEFPGTYCIGCASLLRLVLWSDECAECGVKADSESAAERDGWRYFADEIGQLVPFCPACAAAMLGITPPVAPDGSEVPRPTVDESI